MFFRKASLPVVVCVGCLLPALAPAQDAFDEHLADIVVLQPKPVQKDVGITDWQHTLLKKYADRQAKEVEGYLKAQKAKGVSPNSITPQDPHIMEYFKELRANVIKTLKPGQLKRLREITLQARGYAMLLDPIVQRRLGVTAPQLDKIRAALEEFAMFAQQATRDAYMGVRAQYQNVHPKDQADNVRLNQEFGQKLRQAEAGIRPKIQAAHLRMDQEVEVVLTRPQRANWIALLGRSFKASQ